MNWKIVTILVGSLIACSQASTDERLASTTSQALDGVAFGPIAQAVALSPSWTGNEVELLSADAYYDCTNVVEYAADGTPGFSSRRRRFEHADDVFLADLMAKMSQVEDLFDDAHPPAPPTRDLARDWYDTRAWLGGFGFNVDSVLAPGTPALPGFKFASPSSSTSLELALDTDFRTAGFNLCMAQVLRRQMPGSAANSALFVPKAQQRQLLEIIRERSQIAMLEYALFASVLGEQVVTTTSVMEQDRLGEISSWLHNLPPNVRSRMGTDFATSVQLNVMATEEMGAAPRAQP